MPRKGKGRAQSSRTSLPSSSLDEFEEERSPVVPRQRARSNRAHKGGPGNFVLLRKPYLSLELHVALQRVEDYPMAALELAEVLRLHYTKAEKAVQHAAFQDVRLAVGELARHGTQRCAEAAQQLLRAAEVLPHAKRHQVGMEHKQAVIALHRQRRRQGGEEEEEDGEEGAAEALSLAPVLHTVFLMLAPHQVAQAACVCREWRAAAEGGPLWEAHYQHTFGPPKAVPRAADGPPEGGGRGGWGPAGGGGQPEGGWRAAFMARRAEDVLRVPTTRRALCRVCKQLVWRERSSPHPRGAGGTDGRAAAAAAAAGQCEGHATAPEHRLNSTTIALTPPQAVTFMVGLCRISSAALDSDEDAQDRSLATSSSSSSESESDSSTTATARRRALTKNKWW